jgi:hypothetical protein
VPVERVGRAALRRSFRRRSRKALCRFLRFTVAPDFETGSALQCGCPGHADPTPTWTSTWDHDCPAVGSEPWRGSLSDRILKNRCTRRTVLATDPEIVLVTVPRSIVPPFHPSGYMDKAPLVASPPTGSWTTLRWRDLGSFC